MNRSSTMRSSSRTFVAAAAVATSAAAASAAAASAISLLCSLPAGATTLPVMPPPQVQLVDGVVAGDRSMTGIHQLNVFRGIPYAAPPIAENRWREPQRLAPWPGVREAKRFGPRCMQMEVPDLASRSTSMSEDCLYLNVWAPATNPKGKLPVLVYFHGGNFAFGDSSEPRYDGSHLAARGMIVVTVNYRLGVFGFLMHPDAARDSATGAAGNYGLLDQQAALRWVRDNIDRFGGDPDRVTIGGETTGAMAVSAHMASPSSRGLFARAIGESGGAFGPNAFWKRERAEQAARAFAARAGADSLQALRALPAEKVQQAMGTYKKPAPLLWPSIDGYFLSESPAAVFEAGRQAPVPLLVGSNTQESYFRTSFGPLELTPENWTRILNTVFGSELPEARRFYPGTSAEEVAQSASMLANDLTMTHSTWRWMDLHRQTGRASVYFYLFAHRRPPMTAAAGKAGLHEEEAGTGAPHRSEIHYAFGNLDQDPRYRWTKDDRAVARTFSTYVERFVKSGTPNGTDHPMARLFTGHVDRVLTMSAASGAAGEPPPSAMLGRALSNRTPPHWPAVRQERDGLTRQVIDTNTRTFFDSGAERQALVQRITGERPGN